MSGKQFVHLHVHSEYSLLDGAARIKDLIRAAVDEGMPALALTDHGVMYGAVDFYKTAKKQGVKPLIGCEVYMARRTRHDRAPRTDDSSHHLVLLAKNEEGYRNLTKLVSRASLEGFYYKPRVDRELLQEHHSGLIALSGCLAGKIAELVLGEQEDEARSYALEMSEIFGQDNFYIEVQDHFYADQRRANPKLIHLARDLGLPLVATNDIHYVRKSDAQAHDALLCIQTGKIIADQDRLKFDSQEFYLKNRREMEALFGEIPDALDNTLLVAERCNFDFDFSQTYLPNFMTPPGYNLESYLEHLCRQGLQRRYGTPTDQIRQRLDYELGVISKMGYAGYFLIVWDFVDYAKQKGIVVGPGRGSAAGSLVAYALGITDIDPIRYNLLFERFLNPERVSMPDIDIDFCFERRGEIIDYVVQKYGQDHVSQIITFGTMAARAVTRDVGRVQDWSYAEVDRVAKLIPGELGITIDRALEVVSELKQLYHDSQDYRTLLDTARALEGIPRHASTHAAGVVISREPLTHYLPVQKTSEGMVTTQYAKEAVEEIGLLKMDLLGLRTLTVIDKAIGLIRAGHSVEVDLANLPVDDVNTYTMLATGETLGVFQLESSGMRAIIRELRPETIEDIIALVALYRPGPLGSGMVEDFIRRKHGEIPVSYLHPLLEPILKDTYGVILYQEQVMRIASDLAGFTLGEADLLRRAMGKKKPEVIAGVRSQFLAGAEQHGVDTRIAGQIFDLMEYFAGYGFNLSHSAAYALIAYQTAYLKANYPGEFLAALLTSVADNSDKVALYVDECRRLGVAILPPDLNQSQAGFTVVKNQIRFGLAAVKNAGEGAVETILQARASGGPFTGLADFCARVDLRVVNRRVIENLIRAGAMASFKIYRSQLLAMLDLCIQSSQSRQRELLSGQISLLDLDGEAGLTETAPEPPPLPEFTPPELLTMEKETLGLYISGHPLDEYATQLRQKVSCMTTDLPQIPDDQDVIVGGLITHLRRTITKRGGNMAYVTLEDLTGTVEVLVFPQLFQNLSGTLVPDSVVLVKGRLSIREDEIKVLADKITPFQPSGNKPGRKLFIKVEGREKEQIIKIQQLLAQYQGDIPVYYFFSRDRRVIETTKGYWVSDDPALKPALEAICGPETVRYTG